jgi:hypothetical protein
VGIRLTAHQPEIGHNESGAQLASFRERGLMMPALTSSLRSPAIAIALALAWGLTTLSAQTKQETAPPQQNGSLTTLSGCVDLDKNNRRSFTLADSLQGGTYTLKGVNMRDYVGKQVELTGSTSKGLKVVGGLYPSPNVAAQAGSIDATQAAMAAQAGPNQNQPRPSVEFNVKSVRTIGACPPAAK